jgi:hypothetical protein
MMAIFTVGANAFQVEKMSAYAKENWGNCERFSEEQRLIERAKLKYIDSVLVFDREALSTKTTSALNSMNVDILCWKENASMKEALKKKQETDEKHRKDLAEREQRLKEIRQIRI